ncbi:hypothetical protein BDP27DRAFT_1214248 [Rhodocollybia butyracea]|uniref:Uncharacterized protein n=1 Tax=Rhodocollybia butyracea TaxID=206335 RepID=A0A9P5Q2Q4_9AGAR|nr:hypothetical protein BDP27DRAFT_1214248 [Rhodocollybia butyracea]
MASTSSQIISIAPYHLSLLQTLDSLQYAPSALKQQTSYLRDLQAELQSVQEMVKGLGDKTKKERKEHEELRDSTRRRLTARLKGKAGVEKLEAKKEKEEREYIEALENEMRERGKQTMLENMIDEAKRVKSDLEEKSTRLDLTKQEISNLYHSVFDGPTTEFPRDDVLEEEFKSAQATYDRLQAVLNSHSQAVNLLTQADQMLGMGIKKIDQALGYSTWDVYGGGNLSDMMERDALANAATYAAKAEMLLNQAQRTSADVQTIGPLKVYDISLFGDVFFDNLFSDIRAHHKIENNKKELAATHLRLKAQLRAARRRTQLAGADVLEASEVLKECNNELERYRRDVLLRIADQGREDPPPAFTRYAPPPGPPPSRTPQRPPSSATSMASTATRGRTPSMGMPEPSLPPVSSLSIPSSSSASPSHRRSRSSITSASSLVPGHDTSLRRSKSSDTRSDNLNMDKALPLAPGQSINQYAPPPGPPPSTSGISGNNQEQADGPSSPSSTVTRVPMHWGSSEYCTLYTLIILTSFALENPFAAMMMMG